MSPVAVAERAPGEVWVVNHLSDSVSIVDVTAKPPRVKRTLLVGDEPRDIVFAANGKAFITTAHRGEQRVHPSLANVPGLAVDLSNPDPAKRREYPGDPQLTTKGIGRADVWVFNGADPMGGTFGGRPERVVTLFGDTPRALAVDGNNVYAAIFHSGNQTSIVNETLVCDVGQALPCAGQGFAVPGGPVNLFGQPLYPATMPPPHTNKTGVVQPEAGLIVKFNPIVNQWQDPLGNNWNNGIRYNLPDYDVFRIDANTGAQTGSWKTVGTHLFNMAVNPANKKVYVTNTEANNFTRFEGAGVYLRQQLGPNARTVLGNLARSRITVLDPQNQNGVTVRPLNPHIRYEEQGAPTTTPQASLSTPLQVVFSSDGRRAYVAGYGSSKVGVIPTAELEAGNFNSVAASASYIPTKGGPAGIVLDEPNNAMYVLTRFDNAVSRIDLGRRESTQTLTLATPEPAALIAGRPVLYDAMATSGNGEAACASCHLFGDMDHLSWDLGDPDGDITINPLTILLQIGVSLPGNDQNGGAATNQFHPNKGPMTTQTLKGMMNHGAMHWRGDRAELGQPLNARESFINFKVATKGLNGRASEISDAEMARFADFVAHMQLPPNPIRVLENDLSLPHKQLPKVYKDQLTYHNPPQRVPDRAANPKLGQDYFFGRTEPKSLMFPEGAIHLADGIAVPGTGFSCEGCHRTNPAQGFFGSDGRATFEGLEQIFKMAQLRNMYTKVGMFGHPSTPILTVQGSNGWKWNAALGRAEQSLHESEHTGDQIRGFGYEHEGSVDTIYTFIQATLFENGGFLKLDPAIGFQHDLERRDVEAYLLAFDNDIAPIVGQQVTFPNSSPDATARLTLLMNQARKPFVSKLLGANARECDLIAKTTIGNRQAGYLFNVSDGRFTPDDGGASRSDAELRAAATDANPITFTCAPFGSGRRMGIDRDLDTRLDGVDNCPSVANQDQRDDNRDGIGNACEGLTTDPEECSISSTANVSSPISLGTLGGFLGLAGLGIWRRRRRA